MHTAKPLFPLGKVIRQKLPPDLETEESDVTYMSFIDYIYACLWRHETGAWGGRWGEVDPETAAANAHALQHGGPIASRFYFNGGDKDDHVEITTSADRSVTRIVINGVLPLPPE